MKKYILTIGIGALFFSSACDTLNQENIEPVDLEKLEIAENQSEKVGGENYRAYPKWVKNLYPLMENAYQMLPSYLPVEKAESTLRNSSTKELFVEKMIKASLEIFDSNLMQNGHILSDLSKRNHDRLAAAEHEITYDIAAGAFRSATAYLKIGDLIGESTDYTVAKIFNIKGGKYGKGSEKGNPWNDSIPPVKSQEAAELGDFILGLNPRNVDPVSLNNALNELEINAGIKPELVALLLPAVQSAREAAKPNSRGKATILIESMGNYGLNVETDLSLMYQIGGMASIGNLTSDDYDAEGDVDWAFIQLNRKKFEFEMFFLWERFWENNQTDPTTGG